MTARARGDVRSWIPSLIEASTLRRFSVAVMNPTVAERNRSPIKAEGRWPSAATAVVEPSTSMDPDNEKDIS